MTDVPIEHFHSGIQKGFQFGSQGHILSRILSAWKSSSKRPESNIWTEFYGKYQQ